MCKLLDVAQGKNLSQSMLGGAMGQNQN